MAVADHNSTIFDINIALTPDTPGQVGFSRLLIIADDTLQNSGDRTKVYTSPSAVDTDLDAGEINSAEATAIKDGFAQSPAPDEIQLGNLDTGVPETIQDAYDAIRDVDDGFYAVTYLGRTSSDQNPFVSNIESSGAVGAGRLFIFQSSESTLTDTSPTVLGSGGGLENYPGSERSVLYYHDEDTEYGDVAWSANRLAFDQDETSPPWFASVQNVADYTTSLTQSEKLNMIGSDAADGGNAVNVGLPAAGADHFVMRGHNGNTRPIYIIVTRDWFAQRLQERVTQRVVEKSARGEKIEVSTEGQAEMGGIIRSQFSRGVDAGHFKAGQLDLTYPEITEADIQAERIPVEAELTVSTAAQSVTFDIDFFRDDVVETDGAA